MGDLHCISAREPCQILYINYFLKNVHWLCFISNMVRMVFNVLFINFQVFGGNNSGRFSMQFCILY